MYDKFHLTLEGIQKIVNLKASLNNGLSADVLLSFPLYSSSTTSFYFWAI